MSKKEIKHPDRQETENAPYSAAIECDGWLYVSGQGPVDLTTMEVQRGTIEEETRRTLENVRLVLEAGGCTFDDVVKCTCYIADMADFDAFSRVYREHFKMPRPARSTIEAPLWGEMKVEIDAIARIPKK
jgi:2-iminobutanoate/2-iminopropanoate deaminase